MKAMQMNVRILCALAGLAAASGVANGQSWIGGVSSFWNEPTNWDNGIVPLSGSVTISNAGSIVVLDRDFTARPNTLTTNTELQMLPGSRLFVDSLDNSGVVLVGPTGGNDVVLVPGTANFSSSEIRGNGTIQLQAGSATESASIRFYNGNFLFGGQVIHSAPHKIQGAGLLEFGPSYGNGTLVNSLGAVVMANDFGSGSTPNTLKLTGSVFNAGEIKATTVSGASLGGRLLVTGSNIIQSNTGNLAAEDESILEIESSTITGGTISSVGNGVTRFIDAGSVLADAGIDPTGQSPRVTLLGDIEISENASVKVRQGGIFAQGVLATKGSIVVEGTDVLIDGNDTIKLEYSPGPASITGDTFTLASPVQIIGEGSIANSFRNNGTIRGTGNRFILNSPRDTGQVVHNNGLIAADGPAGSTATVTLATTEIDQKELAGTGVEGRIIAGSGRIIVDSSKIRGGSLGTSGAGEMRIDVGGSGLTPELTSVTLAGEISMNATVLKSELAPDGVTILPITNNARLLIEDAALSGGVSDIRPSGSVCRVEGNGEIRLNGRADNFSGFNMDAAANTLVQLGAGQTITGQGYVFNGRVQHGGTLSLDSQDIPSAENNSRGRLGLYSTRLLLGSTSRTIVDIDTRSGIPCDLVTDVTGDSDVVVSGTLELRIAPGGLLAGQTVTIFSAGSVSGRFTNVIAPSLPGIGVPQVRYIVPNRIEVSACYANCDGSTTNPVLGASDFSCFLAKFRAGDAYANCDGSTTNPVLGASDFSCFLSRFRAGCN